MTAGPNRGPSRPAIRPRIAVARALIRAGKFIQSAAIMVMRADDLVEFGRRMYARPNNVEGWSGDDVVAPGLTEAERVLLEQMPRTEGRLLLLGVGGGREAIPLARMGFSVTGLDFVPEMVAAAQRNAARQGLAIEGLVQELAQLRLAPECYDVIWLSAAMYSCIPTRLRRIEALHRIKAALRPGGYFVCQFSWKAEQRPSRRAEIIRRGLAYLTLGNLKYEPGDILRADVEFIHDFSSEAEIRSELAETGLELLYFQGREGWMRGEALLRKPQGQAPASISGASL